MNYIKIFALVMLLGFVACTQTEKVINPVDTSEKFFMSFDGDNPTLKVIELPSKEVHISDYFKEILNVEESFPVTNIREFGGNYYLIVSGGYKIYVVRKSDSKLLSTVDFSDEQLMPDDIVFANATDAYVSHSNSVYVTLLDITNFVRARKISAGNPPHAIASKGNQIYVSNQTDNTISVIDSRDKREVAKLTTEPNPVKLGVSVDGKNLICLCAGMGKLDNNSGKTPAFVQYFDTESRENVSSIELGLASIPATDQLPLGLVVTSRDWGFVPTNENFFRLDIRTKDKINLITRRYFYFINHDAINAKLILLRQNENRYDVMLADDKSGDIADFYSFQEKIVFVSKY